MMQPQHVWMQGWTERQEQGMRGRRGWGPALGQVQGWARLQVARQVRWCIRRKALLQEEQGWMRLSALP